MPDKHIWLKSKLPALELDVKSVQFCILLKAQPPDQRPKPIQGNGQTGGWSARALNQAVQVSIPTETCL